tara:strand:- start:132 stop:812 length:681 start_codon:yes stop_codon:yes gene_type:complete
MFEATTVELNQDIVKNGLVNLTWGNGSVIDRETSTVYIKPSGINVSDLLSSEISKVNLNGEFIGGKKPSVDTDIHLELYRGFSNVQSIVHTHSKYCTIFAQLEQSIPALGTTHADYFWGDIPIINQLTPKLIESNYESNTGKSVVQHFKNNKISSLNIPAALLPQHGILTWGASAKEALENAIVAELCAEMAYKQLLMSPNKRSMNNELLDKHFSRKHGSTKYYGQ